MINFIIDENLSFELIKFLKSKGFPAKHIKKMNLGGTKNGELYKIIEKNKAWFLTKDKDFSVKTKFDQYKVGGIIVLNLSDESTKNFKNVISKVLIKLKNDLSKKKLVLVKDEKIIIM